MDGLPPQIRLGAAVRPGRGPRFSRLSGLNRDLEQSGASRDQPIRPLTVATFLRMVDWPCGRINRKNTHVFDMKDPVIAHAYGPKPIVHCNVGRLLR